MEKMINAGVLFCGGCNCYYDREELFARLKRGFGDQCRFSIYSIGTETKFDLVVLINGCQSECLMRVDYPGSLLVINNLNNQKAEALFGGLIKELKREV